MSFVSLVCRDKREKRKLEIRRELVGTSRVPFEPQVWEFQRDERCVSVRRPRLS